MKLYGYELPDDACERVGTSLGHLGGKWALPAIAQLESGPVRSNALRRALPGVSQKVFTQTLRTLERNGYINRHVTATVPPEVQYALTPACRELIGPISAVVRIAAGHSASDRAVGIEGETRTE